MALKTAEVQVAPKAAVQGKNENIVAQQQSVINAQNDKIRQLAKQIQAFRASGKPDDSGIGQYNSAEIGLTPSI